MELYNSTGEAQVVKFIVLRILSVRFPGLPWVVARIPAWNITDLATYGSCLFTLGTETAGSAYDISDPSNIVEVARFSHGNNIQIADKYAYFIHYAVPTVYSVADSLETYDAGYIAMAVADFCASGSMLYCLSYPRGLSVWQFEPPGPYDLNGSLYSFAPEGLLPDDIISLRGRVDNYGPSSTTVAFPVQFIAIPLDRDPTTVSLCDPLIVGPGLLFPQGTLHFAIDRQLHGPAQGLQPGYYKVGIRLDPNDVIHERRERENISWAQGSLCVWASSNDLECTSFDFSPDELPSGQILTLSGNVTYSGDTPCTQGVWVEFCCSMSGDFDSDKRLLCDSLLIPPGISAYSDCSFLIQRRVYDSSEGISPGLYAVALVIDRPNLIPERDESNNAFWRNSLRLLIRRPITAIGRWRLYR